MTTTAPTTMDMDNPNTPEPMKKRHQFDWSRMAMVATAIAGCAAAVFAACSAGTARVQAGIMADQAKSMADEVDASYSKPRARVYTVKMEKRPIPLSTLRALPEYPKLKYRFLKDSVTSAHLTQLNDVLQVISQDLSEMGSEESFGKLVNGDQGQQKSDSERLERIQRAVRQTLPNHRNDIVFEETEALDWAELEEWRRLAKSFRGYESEQRDGYLMEMKRYDQELEARADKITEYEAELLKADAAWFDKRLHLYEDNPIPLPIDCSDYKMAMSSECTVLKATSKLTGEQERDLVRLRTNLLAVYFDLSLRYGIHVEKEGYESMAYTIDQWHPSEVREAIGHERRKLAEDMGTNQGTGGSDEQTAKTIEELWAQSPEDQLIVTVGLRNSGRGTMSVHHIAKLQVLLPYDQGFEITMMIDDYEQRATIQGGETKVLTLRTGHLDKIEPKIQEKIRAHYGTGTIGAQVVFQINYDREESNSCALGVCVDVATSNELTTQSVGFADGEYGIF